MNGLNFRPHRMEKKSRMKPRKSSGDSPRVSSSVFSECLCGIGRDDQIMLNHDNHG